MKLCLLLGSVLALGLAGCGDGQVRLPVVPVKGTLQIDGKAFGPCNVVLSPTPREPDPKKARKAASAVVKADGTFTLKTYAENDGAAPGMYDVTIAADMSDAANPMGSTPQVKPLKIEIKKEGHPNLEIKLEGTGQKNTMGIGPPPM